MSLSDNSLDLISRELNVRVLVSRKVFGSPTEQEAQLLQRDRAMLRVTEYFDESLKVTENGTIRKAWLHSFLFAFRSICSSVSFPR